MKIIVQADSHRPAGIIQYETDNTRTKLESNTACCEVKAVWRMNLEAKSGYIAYCSSCNTDLPIQPEGLPGSRYVAHNSMLRDGAEVAALKDWISQWTNTPIREIEVTIG